MKILIMSDSHGHNELVREAIGRHAPIDLLIHAGDAEGDLDEILGPAREYDVRVVSGNMDWYGRQESELCFPLGAHHVVYLAHGHRLGVHGGFRRIVERAKECGADIAVFGHIHVPVYEERDGITLINPGSIAKPRQEGWKKSYVLMTLEEDGSYSVRFKYLPGSGFFL